MKIFFNQIINNIYGIVLLDIVLIFIWLMVSINFIQNSMLSTLLFVLLMCFLIISMNNKVIGNMHQKKHLLWLILLVLFVRLSYLIFISNNSFNYDSGEGIMFVDGDWDHYSTLANNILSSWHMGDLSRIMLSYLPSGMNGLVYSHVLALVDYLFSENFSFNSYSEVAYLQLFIFHLLRIIITYKLSLMCFHSLRITRISTSIVAFDPFILRWDIVLMKESFFILMVVLTIYWFAKVYYSTSHLSWFRYVFISMLFIYIIFLDRFYLGFFMLTGLVATLIAKDINIYGNIFKIRYFIYLLLLFAFTITYNFSYIIGMEGSALISKSSMLDSISIMGIVKILFSPLPMNATIHFDFDYLIYFGWLIYYPVIVLFVLGVIKIFRNRPRYLWLIVPILILVFVLGLMIPGGYRRVSNFLPIIYIISAYALTRIRKEMYVQVRYRKELSYME
jgi:hypothetical protein